MQRSDRLVPNSVWRTGKRHTPLALWVPCGLATERDRRQGKTLPVFIGEIAIVITGAGKPIFFTPPYPCSRHAEDRQNNLLGCSRVAVNNSFASISEKLMLAYDLPGFQRIAPKIVSPQAAMVLSAKVPTRAPADNNPRQLTLAFAMAGHPLDTLLSIIIGLIKSSTAQFNNVFNADGTLFAGGCDLSRSRPS